MLIGKHFATQCPKPREHAPFVRPGQTAITRHVSG